MREVVVAVDPYRGIPHPLRRSDRAQTPFNGVVSSTGRSDLDPAQCSPSDKEDCDVSTSPARPGLLSNRSWRHTEAWRTESPWLARVPDTQPQTFGRLRDAHRSTV